MTSTSNDIRDVLRRFATVARPIIRENFSETSCIGSTAITIRVLEHYKIKAVPFPCRVLVMNPRFVELVNQFGRYPTHEELLEWTNKDTAWSVGVGYSLNDVGADVHGPVVGIHAYVGHLIVIANDEYMVDASIDQAARPAKQLVVPPVLVMRIPRNFRRGREKFSFVFDQGTALLYEPQPKSGVWQNAPDWKDKNRHTVSAGRILQEMQTIY